MGKRKRWVRCIVCNDYFDRKGTTREYCRDPRCEEKAPKLKQQEKYQARKDKIIEIIKKGCFFKDYNNCSDRIVLHCGDGTYFFEISGWSNSSIMSMSKRNFEETLEKELIPLCQRHFDMVRKVESEGKSFDHAILYVCDKETGKATDKKEMK